MGETTIFLAQVWGPVLLALGAGIFFSREYYTKVYRNLQSETLAVMMAALGLVAIGVVHVMAHNVWDDVLTSVISLLGWLTLAKGIVLAVFPKVVDAWGDRVAMSKNFFAIMGVVAALLGLYFIWAGFLA